MKIKRKLKKLFKGYRYSAEIIVHAVWLYCRYALSDRDVEEIFKDRGIMVDHATIQRWVYKFAPIFEKEFRKRKKRVGTSWRMDETYLKVNGKWHYYYRAVDKNGDTVDYLFRSKRDTKAAYSFFKKATRNNGTPDKINIDKSGSNTAGINAINKENKIDIEIRQNKYLNNRIEGDHRFMKRRTRPMLGFKKSTSAKRTLSGIETIHMIRKNQLNNDDPKLTNYGKFVSLFAA
jgi:putative transposase